MKKKLRIGILLITLILMICVWPVCLVRKTADISSNMASDYEATEQFVSNTTPYVQTFVAQTARLDYIKFKLVFDQDITALAGAVHFKIVDTNNQPIVEKDLAFSEYEGYFWETEVNKWIDKGAEYTIVVTVDDEYSNIFQGAHTLNTADDAPGNVSLFMGEEQIDGQGLICYGYGYPLNIKNVVCLWGFILAVGLCLYICCGAERDIILPGKAGVLWDKLWSLLHKYQVMILIAEMLGILLMIAYICRNKAVDWDEAYSVMMVTKLSLSEMLHTTALDMHPPLFYIMLRIFGTLFGTSFFALKMMSVLFTGCTMLLGVTIVRKNWGAKAAFLFNLVIGLGPQFIFYSVNIRMYALVSFFVIASALLAYNIIQNSGKLNWILFVLSSLGGVYTHYFAVVPLTLIYGYLLVGLFLERKRDCKYFVLGCVMTVAGYVPWLAVVISDRMKGIDALIGHLPWLSVVLKSFTTKGTGGNVDWSKIDLKSLWEWMFSTNIKYSSVMGVGLLVVGIIMFCIKAHTYSRKKRLFLEMLVANLLLSYVIISIIASVNTHFMDNRYVFAALGTFWLFVVIIFSERGRMVSCMLVTSLSIFVLSSYNVQMAVELGTNNYIGETYNVLEQIREEEAILYNFPTYHILYGAHLPEQDFVWIEDMDWENFEGDYIYFISWGGLEIPWLIQEAYQMQFVDCGTMRFEEGMAGIKLYKVCLNNR